MGIGERLKLGRGGGVAALQNRKTVMAGRAERANVIKVLMAAYPFIGEMAYRRVRLAAGDAVLWAV